MSCNKIKFITLYCHLPRHIQRYYQDLISNEENTYDELIKLLKKRLAMPDHLKFQALHQLEAIGDRSPTQFLRDLRQKYQTAGEVSLTNLRYALALGLPPDLRNVKFSFDTKDLDTTALRVKELYNTTNKLSPSVDNIYSLCNNHVHSLQQPNGNLLVDRDQNTLTKWFINCSKRQWFGPWTNCHFKKSNHTANSSLEINRKTLHSLILFHQLALLPIPNITKWGCAIITPCLEIKQTNARVTALPPFQCTKTWL